MNSSILLYAQKNNTGLKLVLCGERTLHLDEPAEPFGLVKGAKLIVGVQNWLASRASQPQRQNVQTHLESGNHTEEESGMHSRPEDDVYEEYIRFKASWNPITITSDLLSTLISHDMPGLLTFP